MPFVHLLSATLFAQLLAAAAIGDFTNPQDAASKVIEERSPQRGKQGARPNPAAPGLQVSSVAISPVMTVWGVGGVLQWPPRVQVTDVPAPNPWPAAPVAPAPAAPAPNPWPAAPVAPAPAAPLAAAAPAVPVPPAVQQPARIQGPTVMTQAQEVMCRRFPDIIGDGSGHMKVYKEPTALQIDCWTTASIDGANGRIQNDGIWVKIKDDQSSCFINELEIQDKDYQSKVKYCAPPRHWVGVIQEQYNRQDCYTCPSLDCQSSNLGAGRYVDVDCFTNGEAAGGNRTWYKSHKQNCFYPGAIFVERGWLGTPGSRCVS
ncbi:hypothetical protein EJ06DRAFT_124434 [Trichodelitschia bisporula]|uniref:Uncharacterized protein n=1 Tax=Trichodelitschia bisporula TaxID=703511 RepID=A0A6G1HQ05_9PEZI|nr:hypothetical protein EJ06DRAFT_124434 [Trichodelitschia bisporula]